MSVAGIDERLLPLTPEDVESLKNQGLGGQVVTKPDGGSYVQTEEDGSCPFMKDNACSIYERRMTTCRSYPFSYSKYNGLVADMTCPGWGTGWTELETIRAMIDQLNCLYLHLMINSGKLLV